MGINYLLGFISFKSGDEIVDDFFIISLCSDVLCR